MTNLIAITPRREPPAALFKTPEYFRKRGKTWVHGLAVVVALMVAAALLLAHWAPANCGRTAKKNRIPRVLALVFMPLLVKPGCASSLLQVLSQMPKTRVEPTRRLKHCRRLTGNR